MTLAVGFVVNPIAGMGGRVGLKGTDGVVEQAVALGARPTAHERADVMLRELRTRLDLARDAPAIAWLTCAGSMGSACLTQAGFPDHQICCEAGPATGAADTVRAVQRFLERGAELILFCGGDGTARDVWGVTRDSTPILGIPAGVKMYSGVFGVSPEHTAELLIGHLRGELDVAEVEVLDIDEERYRRGEWAVRLHGVARTPWERGLTQTAKALVTSLSDPEMQEAIAADLLEQVEAQPDSLFILGAGSTVQTIAHRLGIEKTLLGIDAVAGGERVGSDLNEAQILALLERHPRRVLVLSPIGAQGFVLGRGTQPLSPAVVRRIGPDNVVVVATPAKLLRTPVLRFDTGDRELDAAFARNGYLPVTTGHHRRRLVRVAA